MSKGQLATSFAARRGASPRDSGNLVNQLPPLLEGAEDFRIDISPMLLYGSLVMDRTAFNCITSDTYSKNQFLARQLADFYEAGLVMLHDFSAFNSEEAEELDAQLAKALGAEREFWIEELRRTISWWEQQHAHYANVYGDRFVAEAAIPWSISAVLEHLDLPVTDKNVAWVRAAIFSNVTDDERKLADIALSSLVNYTNCNKMNGIRFDAPVFDWPDMHGFMTARDRLQAASYHAKKLKTARFVSDDLAKIDPRQLSNDQVIAMLKDRRIADFRAFVDWCTQRGSAILPEQKEKLFKALVDHGVQVQKSRETRLFVRLVTAAVTGNFGMLETALESTRLPVATVKGIDDFIKGEITEFEMPEEQPPVFKAIYALRRHAA